MALLHPITVLFSSKQLDLFDTYVHIYVCILQLILYIYLSLFDMDPMENLLYVIENKEGIKRYPTCLSRGKIPLKCHEIFLKTNQMRYHVYGLISIFH